jgi:hypothetical protein
MPSRVANYLELVHIAAAVTHKQPPGTNRNTTSEKKNMTNNDTHIKNLSPINLTEMTNNDEQNDIPKLK